MGGRLGLSRALLVGVSGRGWPAACSPSSLGLFGPLCYRRFFCFWWAGGQQRSAEPIRSRVRAPRRSEWPRRRGRDERPALRLAAAGAEPRLFFCAGPRNGGGERGGQRKGKAGGVRRSLAPPSRGDAAGRWASNGHTATVGRVRERRQGAARLGSAQARWSGPGAPPAAGCVEPRSVRAGRAGGSGSGT